MYKTLVMKHGSWSQLPVARLLTHVVGYFLSVSTEQCLLGTIFYVAYSNIIWKILHIASWSTYVKHICKTSHYLYFLCHMQWCCRTLTVFFVIILSWEGLCCIFVYCLERHRLSWVELILLIKFIHHFYVDIVNPNSVVNMCVSLPEVSLLSDYGN